MSLPITGPYSRSHRSNTVDGYALNAKEEWWYRQKRPYDRPLPYRYINRITSIASDWSFGQSQDSSGGISVTQAFDVPTRHRFGDGGSDFIQSRLDELGNRVRAKLDAKISDPTSMLTAILEGQSTIDMITSKLVLMASFVRKWRSGNRREAILSVLKAQRFSNRAKESRRRRKLRKLADKPRTTPISQSLSSAWVETWFGWLPTIGDVQKGLANLSRDFPFEYVTAGSSLKHRLALFEGSHEGHFFMRAGVFAKVSNPNLYLASQLGLTNPVYTAFEVLPYSWLMAWFGNLEQFFRQFSTYHGVVLEHPWYVWGCRDHNRFDRSFNTWSTRPVGEQTCISFERALGLPGVTLVWKGINRLSVTRGATLASLLNLRLSSESARLFGR